MHKSLVKLAVAVSSPRLHNESDGDVSLKHTLKAFYEADKATDATRARALTLWNELIPVSRRHPQTGCDTLAVLAVHLTVAAILHDLHNWSELPWDSSSTQRADSPQGRIRVMDAGTDPRANNAARFTDRAFIWSNYFSLVLKIRNNISRRVCFLTRNDNEQQTIRDGKARSIVQRCEYQIRWRSVMF